MLASLGDEPTRKEAKLMVREMDTDGDGFIDLHEFVEMKRRRLRQTAAEEEIVAAFAVFSLDKNGRITVEELQAVLRRLGGSMGERSSTEECKQMISGVDRKGVGHVDFDDFMTPLSPHLLISGSLQAIYTWPYPDPPIVKSLTQKEF